MRAFMSEVNRPLSYREGQSDAHKGPLAEDEARRILAETEPERAGSARYVSIKTLAIADRQLGRTVLAEALAAFVADGVSE